jgi:serine/threonine protein kinase
MINTTIGNYKITKLIGEGGMATVYEAEHELLGSKAAIKVLNPVLSANKQLKERFINEAKLMASLDHTNITKVIDFDNQPNQLSIVMEFLDGEDLNEKIKRNGAISEVEINNLYLQILEAFKYAHSKGVVHRDIKPSNIFILRDGTVKILDFGIAKIFNQESELTQTGTQIGTPIYMSPEQVKADKTIDHRSDIYSLGATLFYAINGKPPYNSNTTSQFDIFNKIVFEQLPELNQHPSLNRILKKACAKERELRFQNCDEWLNELKHPSNAVSNSDKTQIEGIFAPKIDTSKNSNEKTIIQNENDSVTSSSKVMDRTIIPPSKESGNATAALIIGIINIFLCWIPILGIIMSTLAIALGASGKTTGQDEPSSNKGYAVAGIVIGIITLFINLIVSIIIMSS